MATPPQKIRWNDSRDKPGQDKTDNKPKSHVVEQRAEGIFKSTMPTSRQWNRYLFPALRLRKTS